MPERKNNKKKLCGGRWNFTILFFSFFSPPENRTQTAHVLNIYCYYLFFYWLVLFTVVNGKQHKIKVLPSIGIITIWNAATSAAAHHWIEKIKWTSILKKFPLKSMLLPKNPTMRRMNMWIIHRYCFWIISSLL